MEPIALSLFRCLPRSHPIYKLLRPHLQSVTAPNTRGRKTILYPSHPVNLAFGIVGKSLAVHGYKKFSFNNLYLPEYLKKKGTLDKNLLPNYHYRDDLLMLWPIVQEYVSDVINHFYKSKEDIKEDFELQDWIKDIAEEGVGWDGNLRDVPSSFSTVEELIRFCTIVVGTSSLQHAATNFGQFDYYKFIPNAPGTMRKNIHKHGESNLERIMESLPTTKMALIQISFAFELTRYAPNEIYIGEFPRKLFYEPEIDQAMKKFADALKVAGDKIDERNKGIEYPYEYLHPKKVPTGIAV